MKKLKEKKTEIDIQIRALQEDIVNGKIRADEAKTKFEELRSKKAEVEKEIALAAAPVEKRSTGDFYKAVSEAMQEKRAITLSGTGAINQVKELAKELSQKTPILEKVRYFYGPNAATNIPVLSPGLATPATAAEGATSIAVDSTAVLGNKSLTPHAFVSILPVSLETIKLGSIDFEAELPVIFADAFGLGFHKQILTGTGTSLDFQGLFTGIPAANQIACSEAGNPLIVDLVNLALTMKDYVDNAVIVLNPAIYSGVLADATIDDTIKIYKEELIRNKTIENVPVILTGAAPKVLTAGSIVAVAGRLDDYGFALASEISIEPIKKVGDTNTYFQASVFGNGAKVVDKNFYGLKTVSS
jgi:HK97 family phage major capsid protein